MLLLHEWSGCDAARSEGAYSCDNKGKSERECDLRQEVFALAVEEARKGMARRQAHRVIPVEAVYVVAQ